VNGMYALGEKKDSFGQRCFAGIYVGADSNISDLMDSVFHLGIFHDISALLLFLWRFVMGRRRSST
jgi:hypothetical protein